MLSKRSVVVLAFSLKGKNNSKQMNVGVDLVVLAFSLKGKNNKSHENHA